MIEVDLFWAKRILLARAGPTGDLPTIDFCNGAPLFMSSLASLNKEPRGSTVQTDRGYTISIFNHPTVEVEIYFPTSSHNSKKAV